MKPHKKIALLALSAIICLCCALIVGSGCDSCSKTPEEPMAKVRISSTVHQVLEGESITLRVVVTGTAAKDVTWSSENPSVATVNETSGQVTGVAPGKTTVTATLVSDARVKDSVEVTVNGSVAPTSIRIEGEKTRTGWVGETDTVGVSVQPENGSKAFGWASSDEDVATVADGTVTFRSEGEVTVTVSSLKNPALTDTVTYKVKKGAFFTNRSGYAKNVDYTHQADAENPYILTDEVAEIQGGNPHAVAWFNMAAGRRYYVEATFEMIGDGTSDPWTRAGIGNGTADSDIRAFFLSNKDGKKTFMMNSNNSWGAETARTWVYGVDGRRNIDLTNFTVGMLRDENSYYFTINGKLYWYEETMTFGSVDTLPCIVAKDIQAKITDYSVVLDEAALNEKLASAEYGRKMFDCGTADSDIDFINDNNFDFKNPNLTFNDSRVECLGEKGYLSGNFTVEYYVKNLQLANADSYLSVFLRRYESDDPSVAETISLNYNNINVRTIAYSNKDMASVLNGANKDGAAFAKPLTADSYAHVKIERTIDGGNAQIKVYVDGVLQKFGGEDFITVDYSGAYLVYMGSTKCTAQVRNFAFGATDGFIPATDMLADEKAQAIAEIASYKSADDYRQAEKDKLQAYIKAFSDEINKCDETAPFASIITAFKAEADKLTTDAEYTQQEAEIAATRNAAKAEIESYKSLNDYRTEEKNKLAALIDGAKAEIDGLNSASEIAQAVETFKAEADKLKTAAEYDYDEALVFTLDKGGYTDRIDYANAVDLTGNNAYIRTKQEYGGDDDGSYAVAMFKTSGQKYYAEAFVKYEGQLSGNGWARFGIGNATGASDGNARAFYVSPQQKATVMMDIPNGWGAECGASMIYNANGISSLDFSGGIKLAVLRDGNTYYYLINDKLYWLEKNERFDNTDTYPVLTSTALIMHASKYSVTTDSAVIDAKLASAEFKRQFFNASVKDLTETEGGWQISKSGDGSFYQDVCVRAVGDAATYAGSFYVDFTLSGVSGDAGDFNQKIGVALRRVADEATLDSIMFGAGGSADIRSGWKWDGGHTFWSAQDDGRNHEANLGTADGSYRIEVEATSSGKTITLFKTDGSQKTQILTRKLDFTGKYIVTLGANLCSGTITGVSAGSL